MYEKRFLINESFDDIEVKNNVQKVSKELLGFETRINYDNDGKDIDLISVDDELVAVEVERGGFVYDLWTDDHYEFVLNLGFPTVNMPDRKEKYWMEYYDLFENGNVTYNPRFNKNIFVRTNYFFNQFIVIRPETIMDEMKKIRSRVKVRNNRKIEGWLSFRKEDVETYNMIDGKLYLDTDPLGKLPPITREQKKELEKKKKLIKDEQNKKRLKEISEELKKKKNV